MPRPRPQPRQRRGGSVSPQPRPGLTTRSPATTSLAVPTDPVGPPRAGTAADSAVPPSEPDPAAAVPAGTATASASPAPDTEVTSLSPPRLHLLTAALDIPAVAPLRGRVTLSRLPVALVDAASSLAKELQAAQQFAHNSLAQSTRANYSSHWFDFSTWCYDRGVLPLPADPALVAAHLASLAIAWDDEGAALTDDNGMFLPGRLRPTSVGQRLAAINRVHRVEGHPAPGSAMEVRNVTAGIRNGFGVYVTAEKAALTLPLLTQLIDVTYEPDPVALRDAALLVLLRARLPLGTLAALDVTDIHCAGPDLAVSWPASSRAPGRSTTLRRSAEPSTCPVRHVQALLAVLPAHGPLFRGLSTPVRTDGSRGRVPSVLAGARLTRQGLTKIAGRRLGVLAAPEEPAGWSRLSRAEFHSRLAQVTSPSRAVLRDRALLLTGWAGCLRRSNLSWADWSDLQYMQEEFRLHLRRQKNDQQGKGHHVWLIRGDVERTCPARALSAWREAYGQALGQDPLDSAAPVFTALNRGGRIALDSGVPMRLTGHSIGRIVQDYCARAGLDWRDFGAHSLRAGFITEAAKRNKTAEQIQRISGHKSVDQVQGYVRKAQLRSNAITREMGL